jgi:hypothetical protein
MFAQWIIHAIFWFPVLFHEGFAHHTRAFGSIWLQAILIVQGLYQQESGAKAQHVF